MLKIRLQRTGRKNIPTFRIVLTDSKNSTKSGKYLEILGNHDPRNEDKTSVASDRVKHWMAQGAKLSDTLHNLFISKKIIEGKKVNVLPKKTPIKKEVVDAPVAAAPAAAPAPVEASVEAPVEAAPAPEPAPVVEEAPAPAPAEAPAEETPAA